jgi:hypothetical protein
MGQTSVWLLPVLMVIETFFGSVFVTTVEPAATARGIRNRCGRGWVLPHTSRGLDMPLCHTEQFQHQLLWHPPEACG